MQVKPQAFALICAAGTGKRFGSDLPKQYHKLETPDGPKSILRLVIDRFRQHPEISGVVVAISPEDKWFFSEFKDELVRISAVGTTPSTTANASNPATVNSTQTQNQSQTKKVKKAPLFYCYGFGQRYHTVAQLAGSALALTLPDDLVLVHDAARPLISDAEISELIKFAQEHIVSSAEVDLELDFGLEQTPYLTSLATENLTKPSARKATKLSAKQGKTKAANLQPNFPTLPTQGKITGVLACTPVVDSVKSFTKQPHPTQAKTTQNSSSAPTEQGLDISGNNLDRSQLILAQTPQIFRIGYLASRYLAYLSAKNDTLLRDMVLKLFEVANRTAAEFNLHSICYLFSSPFTETSYHLKTNVAAYLDAYAASTQDYSELTDEVGLAVKFGHGVANYYLPKRNFKITTSDDLALAQFYLNQMLAESS